MPCGGGDRGGDWWIGRAIGRYMPSPMPTSGGLAIWLGIVLPLAAGQVALWVVSGQGSGVRVSVSSQRSDPNPGPALNPEFLPAFIAPHVPACCTNRASSGSCWPAAPC